MSEAERRGWRWLDALAGRRRERRPSFPLDLWEASLSSGLEAVLAAERGAGSVVRQAIDGDGAAAVSESYGAAISGRRATAVVSDDDLGSVIDRLRTAAARHAPLVIYVVARETGTAERLSSSGRTLAIAQDPQHAIDLGLIARFVAERALAPVAVVIEAEGVADAVGRWCRPPAALVEHYLGRADDRIPTPTPAQATLFGERRRRVPRWFDPARPTAHGMRPRGPARTAAEIGREVFFASSVPVILDQAIETLAGLTGRDAGRVRRFGPADARHVLLLHGSAVPIAAATVLRGEAAIRRTAVVAIDWWTTEALGRLDEITRSATVLTVFERVTEADRRFTDGVVARCRRDGLRIVTAGYGRLSADGVRDACRNAEAGLELRARLELDLRPPSLSSEFPRRQAMLDRLKRDYPVLDRLAVARRARSRPAPPAVTIVALRVESPDRPENALAPVVERLAVGNRTHVRGRLRLVEHGLWEVRLALSVREIDPADADAAVGLLLLGHVDQTIVDDPLSGMTEGGTVVLASALEPAALGASLPDAWRTAIRAGRIRLFRVAPGDHPIERLLEAAGSLLGAGAARVGESVAIEPIGAVPEADRPPLPLAVRRFGTPGESFDNVARFWSEWIEPRSSEPDNDAVPDPYLAAGAVPACSSSLFDATAGRETVPTVDPAICTGCGRCWESCPDSAIAPVALTARALLESVDESVVHPDDERELAARLARARRQLAARVESSLADGRRRSVGARDWHDAFEWLFAQLRLERAELARARRIGDRWVAELGAIPLSVCDPFFSGARARGGEAELLMLAVNPRTCQGCGICVSVCPESAVGRPARTAEILAGLARTWRRWEALPDTGGATIARLAESNDMSPVAAVLLSRHALLAVTGSGAEPGSGERLATRQIAAVIEFQRQRRVLRRVRELDELARGLRSAIRETLGAPIEFDDLRTLERALEEPTAAGGVLARLERSADGRLVDERRLRGLLERSRDVEAAARHLREGEHGLGQSRYGVVLHGEAGGAWAGRFPLNPFSVPVALDLARDGAAVAAGLAASLVERAVDDARRVRRAALWLEAPVDLAERERPLAAVDAAALTEAERAAIAPIVLLADGAALESRGADSLFALLSGDLPIKLVLFDPCDPLASRLDPLLVGLAAREAFVLSASVSAPRQLFDGVSAAIDFPGPALISIHAPSPRRHGFATAATIERARGAVEAHVHPLLRYDPRRPGVLATRIDLDGNSAVERDRAPDRATASCWARGERRFRDDELLLAARDPAQPTVPGPNGRDPAPGESLALLERIVGRRWETLRELAGGATASTDEIERSGARPVAEHNAELAALRDEYEARIERQSAMQAERLRKRLRQLVGHGER
ncbi:MAG TPA: 4Fe-4S binding protein [Candidatus Polarisedimenticolaceae bacterium]|nr:4Fe-4S binding protein [Candidatus Polarisedimenticolaceae bacterium]